MTEIDTSAVRQHIPPALWRSLHPLVQAEVTKEVDARRRIAANMGKSAIGWRADDLATCINVVLFRLRQAKFGRVPPADLDERRRQVAEVAAEAGMTVDGVAIEKAEKAA